MADKPLTFTQRKRRDQLVECAIDAVVEVGFPRTSIGEVARRAGVSKGVVTYHFPTKDELILAVVGHVFDSVTEWLESRLAEIPIKNFVAGYIRAWVKYYAAHTRNMLAIAEIWVSYRDESDQRQFGVQAIAGEHAVVAKALELGQADGTLGSFDARVMAISMKGALDALLGQLAADPDLDLDGYGAELVALFERATRPQDIDQRGTST
jgi:TetR/AcrR family transcriptional regulator, fatty acid metabolism regulator protein